MHGYPTYDNCPINGNFVYSDSNGAHADDSSLIITKYSPTEVDGYERCVFASPLSPGILAFYNTAYLTVKQVVINGEPRVQVSLIIKNYRGQTELNSSGLLNQ
jgi:hypothetical protein